MSGNGRDVAVSSDGQYVYANLLSVCYISTDGGDTFTVLNNANNPGFPGGFQRVEFAIAPSNENYVYAIAVDNGTLNANNQINALIGVYQSTDRGTTWTSIIPGKGTYFMPTCNPGVNCQGTYDLTIAVSPPSVDI